MRTRLHCLLPDLDSARGAMHRLHRAGIEVRHMHFVARQDMNLAGLHEANVLQTSDVLRSAEMGMVVGCGVGALLGLFAAVHYPIVGVDPQWSMAAILPVAGALFGTWTATMIGVSTPSKSLEPFAGDIAQGRILLLVDVAPEQAGAIEAQLNAHPAAAAD